MNEKYDKQTNEVDLNIHMNWRVRVIGMQIQLFVSIFRQFVTIMHIMCIQKVFYRINRLCGWVQFLPIRLKLHTTTSRIWNWMHRHIQVSNLFWRTITFANTALNNFVKVQSTGCEIRESNVFRFIWLFM